MTQNDLVFLVLVKVSLLGGGEKTEIDVIRAESCEEAVNVARNIFSQAGESQAVVYGKSVFFPSTFMAVEAETLAEIDMSQPNNSRWIKSLEAFEVFDRIAEDDEKDPSGSFQNPTFR